MDNIVIIGSSGHAKVVIDIVEQEGKYKIAGLIDLCSGVGEDILGYKILGREEDLKHLCATHDLNGVIVAIGDNFIRSKVVSNIKKICPNLTFVSAVHPKSYIGRDVSIGDGTVVMAGVTVNPCSVIGQNCVLNTNSSIDHDSMLDDFSSIAPNATIGGNCQIGGHSVISIGAVVIHGIHIGEHSVIGAGSTVLDNIESFKLVYGTPAKVIRERKSDDKYL